MIPVERGYDKTQERRLYSLELSSAEDVPDGLVFPSRHFACLIAWDARLASADSISAIIVPLLKAGASYFVCWGPDCEHVHDIIDEVVSTEGEGIGIPDGTCIMISWHDSESLEEALLFCLMNTCPDPRYEDTTRTALAISVGEREWNNVICSALDDPVEFVRRINEK
ncbi:MAG TPA: hypothetical protein VF268_13995 [Gammaproteobacteria bacterium]